jgi:hypothetical protein
MRTFILSAQRALIPFALLFGTSAWADSWLPPRTETYVSADGSARVTITPRPISGPLSYFQDEVDGEEPAGQRPGSDQMMPIAPLEHLGDDGHWQSDWKVPLVNDVAPVTALVAADGRYLVTFDNWHSMGYGNDVVVIYDSRGVLIRQMSLADILPASWIAFLPRSVSSLRWGGDHHFNDDEDVVVLRIREAGERRFDTERPMLDVLVRLRDGHVLTRNDARWNDALDKASQLDAERQERWQAVRRTRAVPLVAPNGTDTLAWRKYLAEVCARVCDPDKEYGGGVLPVGGDGAYPNSAEAIKAQMDQFQLDPKYGVGQFLFTSPSTAALSALLVDYLGSIPPGSMTGSHITVIGTPGHEGRLQPAARKAGTELEFIDQAVPIPGEATPESAPDWYQ